MSVWGRIKDDSDLDSSAWDNDGPTKRCEEHKRRFWRKINFVNFRHTGFEVMINYSRTDI